MADQDKPRATETRSVATRPNLIRTLLMFFSVIGPGIITANADNDVGGIQTYSIAGAQFGYSMLWLLVPVTIAADRYARDVRADGAVTGKGLADLIRENFGVKVTTIVLLLFVLSDLGNTAAEFAGIAFASPVFQQYVPFLSKYLLVPAAAIFVFVMVTARQLPDHREGLLRLLRRVSHVRRERHPGAPAVGRGAQSDGIPAFHADAGIRDHRHRRHRDDDLAVDAVLHPIGRRREGRTNQGLPVLPDRRHHRRRSSPT